MAIEDELGEKIDIYKNTAGLLKEETIQGLIDSGALISGNYIWNIDSLAWEKATGSITEGGKVSILNFPANYPDSDVASLLTSIKNTDGIKKITDSLPAGTNTIGDITISQTSTPNSITATASGTTIIHTTTAGKQYRLKFINVFNSGSATITVDIRFTTTGTARFKCALSANTGFVFNLIGCNWQGGTAESLYINLSGTGTVEVSVFGEEITP